MKLFDTSSSVDVSCHSLLFFFSLLQTPPHQPRLVRFAAACSFACLLVFVCLWHGAVCAFACAGGAAVVTATHHHRCRYCWSWCQRGGAATEQASKAGALFCGPRITRLLTGGGAQCGRGAYDGACCVVPCLCRPVCHRFFVSCVSQQATQCSSTRCVCGCACVCVCVCGYVWVCVCVFDVYSLLTFLPSPAPFPCLPLFFSSSSSFPCLLLFQTQQT